ncbi:MAG: hypothetical protein R3B49_00630 [Phycisphaerales bacterium]
MGRLGVPTGQGGGSSSRPDPTSGFTGSNVYGYNLNGNYTDNMSETYSPRPRWTSPTPGSSS